MMVLRARFELAIHFWRWIFLLLHVAMTAFALQSGVHLDHITIVTQVRAVYSLHIPSFDVSSAIVSKRFPPNLTRFTLVISSQVLKPYFIKAKVHIVSQFQHRSIQKLNTSLLTTRQTFVLLSFILCYIQSRGNDSQWLKVRYSILKVLFTYQDSI